MKSVILKFICIELLLFSNFASSANSAEWTIMVFMNGHNTLDYAIGTNFKQMASVGSTDKVNIVTQVAKLGDNPAETAWHDKAFRFRVEKNMKMDVSNAVDVLGKTDMGNPDVLQKFMAWSAKNYPAKNYMLVIWGHGQGYRVMDLALTGMRTDLTNINFNEFQKSSSIYKALPQVNTDSFQVLGDIPKMSAFRSVSSDDVFKTKLYMNDVQNVVENLVSKDANFNGDKLSIIGFDACLMAMVENAFAFRKSAQYMIASQELEPGNGWDYKSWLAQLVLKPEMSPSYLGTAIIDSYENSYGQNSATTLSETDLSQATELADSVSKLATTLMNTINKSFSEIRTSRSACPEYAPDPYGDGKNYFYHIDLGCFVDGLIKSSNTEISAKALEVRKILDKSIVHNYAGNERKSFGSNGLCIYFPKNKDDFDNDYFAEHGYEKTNKSHPVEFVKTLKWSDFLQAFYKNDMP